MNAFPIRNAGDHERALARIDELWGAERGSPAGDELEILVALVEAYEDKQSTMVPSDPIEAIRYKLGELGWSQREFGRRLGWGTGRVCEILNQKRPLTLRIIRQVAEVLGIPPTTLLGEQVAAGGTLTIDAELLTMAAEAAEADGVTVSDWVESAVIRALSRLTVVRVHREEAVTNVAFPSTSSQPFAVTTTSHAYGGEPDTDLSEEKQAA